MTPYMDANTERRTNFNDAQRHCRNTVERAIGLLKIRFRWVYNTTICFIRNLLYYIRTHHVILLLLTFYNCFIRLTSYTQSYKRTCKFIFQCKITCLLGKSCKTLITCSLD